MIHNKECFYNPKTGEVRATFGITETVYAVVKFFRTDDEVFSVKVWSGNYEKTKSYWNTTTTCSEDKAKVYFALGRDHIAKMANILEPYTKEQFDGDQK